MHVKRFLAVTFVVSWTFALIQWLFVSGESLAATIAKALLAIAFMFGPLVGAAVAQRSAKEPVLKPLGVRFRPNKWWLLAWLGPVGLALLSHALALPLPGVEWSPSLDGFIERLGTFVPSDQIAEARSELDAFPLPVMALLMVLQTLGAGASINALAAFGEEFGWRGYLFKAWAKLGFWRSSLLIGVIWGLWHAPLIAQGHNYPSYPLIGVVVMTAWCTLLAPPFQYLRLRTGSVVAVSITHGTLNASVGLAFLFLKGGGELLVGITGVAGMLALVVVNLLILAFARDLSPVDDT